MNDGVSCPTRALEPPAELLDFAERQVRDARHQAADDRRKQRRYLMVIPVTVQPLDGNLQPKGEAFATASRDISPKGVGLLHTDPIERGLVALRLSFGLEDVDIVTEILWCKERGPFYYVGGKFIRMLKSIPGQP